MMCQTDKPKQRIQTRIISWSSMHPVGVFPGLHLICVRYFLSDNSNGGRHVQADFVTNWHSVTTKRTHRDVHTPPSHPSPQSTRCWVPHSTAVVCLSLLEFHPGQHWNFTLPTPNHTLHSVSFNSTCFWLERIAWQLSPPKWHCTTLPAFLPRLLDAHEWRSDWLARCPFHWDRVGYWTFVGDWDSLFGCSSIQTHSGVIFTGIYPPNRWIITFGWPSFYLDTFAWVWS